MRRTQRRLDDEQRKGRLMCKVARVDTFNCHFTKSPQPDGGVSRALPRLANKCYMWHNSPMRRAGVREARQNLSDLLDDVKKGREVVITEHGRPVARLAPLHDDQRYPDLSRTRRRI